VGVDLSGGGTFLIRPSAAAISVFSCRLPGAPFPWSPRFSTTLATSGVLHFFGGRLGCRRDWQLLAVAGVSVEADFLPLL